MNKRIISLFLAVIMFVTSSIAYFDVHAQVVLGDIKIDRITFRKVHDGYEITGGIIEIWGDKVNTANILFEDSIDGFKSGIGTKETDTSGLVRYTLNKTETIRFAGTLAIEGKTFPLNVGSYPNFSDANEKVYNVDTNPIIQLTGANLNRIKTEAATIKASYGNLEREYIVYDDTTGDANDLDTPTLIKIPNPTAPGGILGTQNLTVEENATATASNGQTFDKRIIYVYNNAFRLIQNLVVTNPVLFPNTGAKDDLFYITANDLNPNKNYQVYFVTDTAQELTDNNKATFVSLAIDYEGSKDRLTFRVPKGSEFKELEYTLILTDVQNNSVIAQKTLPTKFSVVDATYLPAITEIYPTQGPQEGADIQIDGRNLISLNVPDLDTNGANPVLSQDSDGLHINYDNGNYNGRPVTIKKDIVTKIGGKATYQLEGGNIKYVKGATDSLFVHAPAADDAETNPFKDVNIEITITMVVQAPHADAGTEYKLFQVVNKANGFKFIPSSITPTVTKVTPDSIHVTGTAGDFKTGDDMMLVIDGTNFLVNRYTDNTGKVFVNYPSVYIKTLNDQSEGNYDIALKPNVTVATVKGLIYDMSSPIAGGNNYIKNPDNSPYKLDLKVVDSEGNAVTGATNNDVGTRIIARIPRGVEIEVADFKNILIVNPKRNSQDPGNKVVKVEGIRFVDTNDIPIIESVVPNVVTVEGNENIVVTGNNFQEGAKLYLNGNEITTFSRDISQSGDKIILTFKAPKGPAGKTQIVVQNPSGAIGTFDFYYVVSFNKDPVITNFVPAKGIEGTYVIVNGENFLKEDPTVETAVGLDALRLIGSRIYLDGNEVNKYNKDVEGNIKFEVYTAPDAIDFIKRDDAGKKLDLTPFSKNVYIKDNNNVYYKLGKDGDGNPSIIDEDGNLYTFKYETDRINIYNKAGTLLGRLQGNYTWTPDGGDSTKGVATLNIDSKTFTFTLDNNIVSIGEETGPKKVPRIADYAESVILFSNGSPQEYFKIYRDFDQSIKLTNGKDKTYTVEYTASGDKLVARKNASEVYDITNIGDGGFTVNTTPAIVLTMQTAYQYDNTTKKIVGHLGKVLNRNQIAFSVPGLTSGRGYKDLKVVNPDTKYAEKTGDDGFYFIEQASSNPKITNISPNEGSVDGGYNVTITGKDFEQNMSVYVDGVLVPPNETNVATDGLSVVIKMPKSTKDLAKDYNVSELEVPVVVLNNDGGTDVDEKGFKYLIPKSSPRIDKIQPVKGSTNGGDIVEIIGYEFRFFEPYTNQVGGPEYNLGDPFEDLYKDGLWTNLKSNPPAGAITNVPFSPPHPVYANYLQSPVLPKVFFGTKEAKIVEFDNGYLKVITPQNISGDTEVYVMNNDSGVSNKVTFKYESSTPNVTSIIPNHGKRQGLELRDFNGSNFFKGIYKGYANDNAAAIVTLSNLDAQVRFTDITNRAIAREQANSGLINAQRATVNLEGDLRVEYNGSANTITVSVTEGGKIYNRVFSNYNDELLFIPMEMLKTSGGEYYTPDKTDTSVHNGQTYKNLVFEYIKVEVNDKRFLVDRSYAPKVKHLSSTKMEVTTPSYYSVGETKGLITNPDTGTAAFTFKYTFPASVPKIYMVKPREDSPDKTKYHTKRSVKGGTQIEILGTDFRNNVKVQIGTTVVKVTEKNVVETVVDGTNMSLDLLIVDVPAGQLNEVGLEQAMIITNEDFGTANSANPNDILGNDKKPMYFVYQKPLSDPVIKSVTPSETSQYGGNTVTLIGTDFRVGATVTIGSKGGVPIPQTTVSDQGTKLTFVTPNNTLVPGEKTIQVQNEDFGTSGNDKKIKIVSFPTVDPNIVFEDNKPVKWISVEGGQKIRIKGTNFYPDAKVIFGGSRTLDAAGLAGEKGLYKDDKRYNIKDGVLAPKVEFISSTELLVTTPLISVEDPYKIHVLNADGGLSEDNASVLYSVPVPTDPVNLKLEVIDNRYIRISDYTASGHKFYEIYYYLGKKTTSSIQQNNYLDMSYLGSTELEPYRLPRIKGIEDIRSYERLVIGLKAVNEFGSSDWSNLEELTFDKLKDVKEMGDPDTDGDIGVPDGKDYISEVVGTDLITTISAKTTLPNIYIDLSTPDYSSIKSRVINVPGSMIRSSGALIRVDYDGLDVQFTPLALNTKEFQELYLNQNAYGRIESTEIEDAYSGYMLNQVPRGYKVVSKVVTIGYDARNNDVTKPISQLNGGIDIVMSYDPNSLVGYAESGIEMYRFDKVSNSWSKQNFNLNTSSNMVTARTNLPGAYVLMVKRN